MGEAEGGNGSSRVLLALLLNLRSSVGFSFVSLPACVICFILMGMSFIRGHLTLASASLRLFGTFHYFLLKLIFQRITHERQLASRGISNHPHKLLNAGVESLFNDDLMYRLCQHFRMTPGLAMALQGSNVRISLAAVSFSVATISQILSLFVEQSILSHHYTATQIILVVFLAGIWGVLCRLGGRRGKKVIIAMASCKKSHISICSFTWYSVFFDMV